MTAPRPRDHTSPQSQPDTSPPHRGGDSTSTTLSARRLAGFTRRALLCLAVAAALCGGLLAAPAGAQDGDVPDKPRGLEATASHGRVVLTWNDPGDDSITGYVILRRVRVNDTGGDFSVLVANTASTATTYTDTTVAAGLTYTYRIKAINEHGVSERSRWVHIDTPAAPEEEQAAEPPDKPRGLEATASHGQVVLTWDDPGDDSITGYVILRRVRVNNVGGEFGVLEANTGSAATTYTDDTVAAGITYTYRIKAINEYGESERSRWFHIDTLAAPEATFGDDPVGAPGHGTPGGAGTRDNVSEPAGDDFPPSTSTTGEVNVGGSVTGTISSQADADWFKVDLSGGVRYRRFQIDVEGDDTGRGTMEDPNVRLYDAGGAQISGTSDDNGGVGNNARTIIRRAPGGTFYVRVAGTNNKTGTYTLSVIELGTNGASEADTDLPDDDTTNGEVEVGGSVTGRIGSRNDIDWFKVKLEAGKIYQIDLEGAPTGRGTDPDPLLSIESPDGTVTGSDDDGGVGLNARKVFTSTVDGTYHITARSNSVSKQGTYTLSVRGILVATDLPPGGLGPSEVPGEVRDIKVSYSEGTGQYVSWNAPDETETGAQWITEFHIYGSGTGAGCDGYLLDEYVVEHPGFSRQPPEVESGSEIARMYFKDGSYARLCTNLVKSVRVTGRLHQALQIDPRDFYPLGIGR